MSIEKKIQQDLKEALKSQELDKLSTLRMLSSSIHNKQIEKGALLSDDEVIQVIAKEVRKRREAAEQYQKGGRVELAEKEIKEAEILETYLPKRLSEEELRTIIKKVISQTGASSLADMGKVMAETMRQVKGRAEGGIVSKLVRDFLEK